MVVKFDFNIHIISLALNSYIRNYFSRCQREIVQHYNIFTAHWQCWTVYANKNHCFGKSCLFGQSILQSLSHPKYIAFIAVGSLFDVLLPKLLYIVLKDRLGTRLLRLLNCSLYVICNFFIFENFLARNVCA